MLPCPSRLSSTMAGTVTTTVHCQSCLLGHCSNTAGRHGCCCVCPSCSAGCPLRCTQQPRCDWGASGPTWPAQVASAEPSTRDRALHHTSAGPLLLPQVMVTSGKDKGLTGTVTAILRSKNRAIVEGRNLVRPSPAPAATHWHPKEKKKGSSRGA